MKMVIDDRIPYIRGVFEPHAGVMYLPGGSISREHLLDADCLLIRTRTHCTRELLENTAVRFIGTATIGFDHIDTGWCEQNGIIWKNAPGCNSGGVAQYVTAALHEMARRRVFKLKDQTLGIIGVGHVGKKVEKAARELGMNVILNDPPRERVEGSATFTGLRTLLEVSDIITLHVPLNREGRDKTLNLVDRQFLDAMKPGAILINSSRGEVIDEKILIQWMKEKHSGSGFHSTDGKASPVTHHLSLILDVWPHEPDINLELLGLAEIATPHIAGYSVEGKYNATKMIAKEVSQFFSIGIDIPPLRSGEATDEYPAGRAAPYDILADDRRLRESPGTFEQQRNKYPERWEFLH